MFVAIIVGSILGYQTYQAYQESERQRKIAIQAYQEAILQKQTAEINAIKALNQTSKTLFLSHNELEALLAGVKAGKNSKKIDVPAALKNQIISNLREVVYGIHEKNRLEQERHFITTKDATFSPDGTMLASTIALWNVSDGSIISTIDDTDSSGSFIDFSPDGTLLALGNFESIRLWNIKDGRKVRTLTVRSATSIDFSPNGTLLASGGSDATIKLWNVADGREITTLRGHVGLVSSVKFSPDGMLLASGSDDGTIKLWNVVDGREFITLYGHSERVRRIRV